MNRLTRRSFGASAAAFASAHSFAVSEVQSPKSKVQFYPGWRRGELDIHFIHTGVGEQTFFIFPDGTTMLLDCGDTHHEKYMVDVPPQPSRERFGGEWTSRYVQRLVKERTIDYLMVSHWHGDHVGDPSLGFRTTADGRRVVGITAVAEDFRFLRYFDHQFPHAGQYALDPDKQAFELFQEWFAKARAAGMDAQPFRVGARDQIKLVRDASAFPTFSVRNLCANAVIWDGKDGVVDCGAAQVKGGGRNVIHENRLSAAIRVDYGKFSYYTGGDDELTLGGADGKPFNWEQAIGRVCGPVDVAKTNHHAGRFAMSPEFVREIRPQAYVSSVWQAKMVDHHSLSSMCSRELYPGERKVAFGYVAPCVRDVAAKYGNDVLPAGHAVVKVAPGGDTFELFTLSAADESMRILSRTSFTSRSRA